MRIILNITAHPNNSWDVTTQIGVFRVVQESERAPDFTFLVYLPNTEVADNAVMSHQAALDLIEQEVKDAVSGKRPLPTPHGNCPRNEVVTWKGNQASKPIRALVIQSDDEWTVHDVVETELQNLVGGRLELITAEYDNKGDPSTVLWYNTEWEEVNWSATALLLLLGGVNDHLFGTVVVTGGRDPEPGRCLAPVRDDVITFFKNMVD